MKKPVFASVEVRAAPPIPPYWRTGAPARAPVDKHFTGALLAHYWRTGAVVTHSTLK